MRIRFTRAWVGFGWDPARYGMGAYLWLGLVYVRFAP